MDWYYLENGKQAGPVTIRNLSLVASGNVQPSTLVWRDGMAGWEPLSSVKALRSRRRLFWFAEGGDDWSTPKSHDGS